MNRYRYRRSFHQLLSSTVACRMPRSSVAEWRPASWRFWGLYVQVCKMETLREAYQIAVWRSAIYAHGVMRGGGTTQFSRLLPVRKGVRSLV